MTQKAKQKLLDEIEDINLELSSLQGAQQLLLGDIEHLKKELDNVKREGNEWKDAESEEST